MKKKKKISTLKELREEKAKVREEINLSRQGLRNSAYRMRTRLKDKLLRQVLLPASLAGLAAFGIQEFKHSENGHAQMEGAEGQGSGGGPLVETILKLLDSLL